MSRRRQPGFLGDFVTVTPSKYCQLDCQILNGHSVSSTTFHSSISF